MGRLPALRADRRLLPRAAAACAAVNDLTNGHLGQAASSNLLLVLAIPFALVLFARWSYAAWSGRDVRPSPRSRRASETGLIVLVVVFTARPQPAGQLARSLSPGGRSPRTSGVSEWQ